MDIQNIQNLLDDSKKPIFQTNNPHLNIIFEKFKILIITKDSLNIISSFQRKNQYNIIIVDECSIKSIGFFIICFDYTLILIPTSEIQMLFSYFSLNTESTIYCISKNVKAKLEQASNQTMHFNFYEKNDQVFNEKEIPSFLTKFKLVIIENKKTLEFLWKIVNKTIAGFLIKIGYFNSKYDRINHFEEHLLHQIEDKEIDKNKYFDLYLLSRGSSSLVYLIYLIEKEKICLMKMFNKNEEEKKLFEREHENYLNLRHPLFPMYFGTTKFSLYNCLLIEYIEGKTLNEIDFSKVSEKDAIKIIFEIIIALAYLNYNGYIYRDLKPNNIIIDKNYSAYLIDFDRTVKMSSNLINEVKTRDFFYEFMAPEILNGQFFSYSADVYSLGKVMSSILSTNLNYISLSKFGKIFEKCVCQNPDKRPSISELINIFYDCFSIAIFGTDAIKTPLSFHNDIFTFYLFLICEYQNQNALFKLNSYYENGAFFMKKNDGLIIIKLLGFLKTDNVKSLLQSIVSQMRNNLVIFKDISKCILYLNFLADQNNFEAQYRLGLMYYEGKYIERNINKAIYYFTLLANQNHPLAIFNLGMIYYEGKFINRDINKSIYYFTLLANQNNMKAQYCLGKIYYTGEFIKQDIEKALDYFKLSANQNNVEAQYFLGMIYFNGKYVAQDIKKAILYLTLASNLNHQFAQYNLGLLYFNELYVPRDINKSIHFFTKSANQNFILAQYNLGVIYYDNKYVPRDIEKAIQYFTFSADQNYAKAQYALGIIYYEGIYIDKDINKSIYYFKLSANQNKVEAQLNLGIIYSNIRSILFDTTKAIYYFKLAADQNNQYAQLYLGNIYYNFIHGEQDIEKAAHYYQLAADQNNSDAQYNLGLIYYKHYPLPEYFNKVLHYITLAANLNHSEAQCFLGIIYYEGKYVKEDIYKAIHYFTLSSNQNNSIGMFSLGLIYSSQLNIKKGIYYFQLASNRGLFLAHFIVGFLNHEGKYMEQDIDKAIHYYKKASSFNYPFAKNNLGIIFKNGFKDKIPKKIGLSIEYFKEAIKHGNDMVSMYNLAHLYFYEIPDENNIDISIDLLIKSIKQGFSESKVLLSLILCKKHKFNLNNIYNEIISKTENNVDFAADIFGVIGYLLLNDEYCYQREYEKYKDIDFLYNWNYNLLQTKNINDSKANKKNEDIKIPNISEQFYMGFGLMDT